MDTSYEGPAIPRLGPHAIAIQLLARRSNRTCRFLTERLPRTKAQGPCPRGSTPNVSTVL